ncbi:cadmium-translocating P-type ATPase [bacterium]|nr:cadmium-translocating P-type ATPase [bacterium]
MIKLDRNSWIALGTLAALLISTGLAFFHGTEATLTHIPLVFSIVLGGSSLCYDLLKAALKAEFGSDLLAGISIITSLILGEYLAGSLVVLMLSGGQTLEGYAVRKASSILKILAERMPRIAHKRTSTGLIDVSVESVQVGDLVVVLPFETCPVDGSVVEGRGHMDESYLSGEPYKIPKTPGTEVYSGTINGESTLVIRASKIATDSRYAKVVEVMRESSQSKIRMKRLGDSLGAIYTPIALSIAIIAWYFSGDSSRFLAVLTIATPCPLLIAIPVAIIGSISLAAKRGMIIRDPSVLELTPTAKTIILDKTGTLTIGIPTVTKVTGLDFPENQLVKLTASLEQYSKHPLAQAILDYAKKNGITLEISEALSEKPGEGLRGEILGQQIFVTGRAKLSADQQRQLPAQKTGLECVVLIDNKLAGTITFHDEARPESKHFLSHLEPRHGITKSMIVSGDRLSEVTYLAEKVGIQEIHAEKSPEEKVQIVTAETRKAPTIFIGDGINDAPALAAATVGIALGHRSEVTTEAAGVLILDASLTKVDEFLHIAERMRAIALQSAIGGMILSIGGMYLAATGLLSPVAGAIGQEIIDLASVLNALRALQKPSVIRDV